MDVQGSLLGETAADGLRTPTHGISNTPGFPDQVGCDLTNIISVVHRHTNKVPDLQPRSK